MDLPTAFPPDAVAWLFGRTPRTVLCLGGPEIAAAATVAGHDVATAPHPDADLPFSERSIDVVVSARRLPRDLDRVARLLRPGGHLGVVTKGRDHRIPWARKLDVAIGAAPPGVDTTPLVTSTGFGFVEDHAFRFWEAVNRESLATLLRAEGHDDTAITAALALYDDYGRGMDGMQLPWVATAHRATVVDSFWGSPMSHDETGEVPVVPAESAPVEDDDTMLLIDFR